MNEYCKECRWYTLGYEHSHVCILLNKLISDNDEIEQCNYKIIGGTKFGTKKD